MASSSFSGEHEKALKKRRIQRDGDEFGESSSHFQPFTLDNGKSELEGDERMKKNDEEYEDWHRADCTSPSPSKGCHDDSGSAEAVSFRSNSLAQSPSPMYSNATSQSGHKDQDEPLDYSNSRCSTDKIDYINEKDGSVCKRCTGSETCLIAPFVQCNFCARSIGEGETYWLYQGWVICDISCFDEAEDPMPLETSSAEENVGSKSVCMDVNKSEFEFAVNLAKESAPFISCVYCGTRFHRICVNYPQTVLTPAFLDSEFACEDCEEKQKFPSGVSLPQVISAKNIRKTDLSRYMEKRINYLVPEMPKVLVRVVANVPKKYEIDKKLINYMNRQIVDFSFMEKTICCFQANNIGKYHMIFVIYVQEYDGDCPLPNRNSIYIKILDSVRLFEPLERRKTAFQAAIISYLDFMKMRGFEHAFLWCCPPRGPGLDYVFHRKPNDQQVITEPLLINWYKCVFNIAKNGEVLESFSTLKDWVLSKRSSVRRFTEKFPYFPGDHWPDTIIELIDAMKAKNYSEGWLLKEIKLKLQTSKNSFYALTFKVPTVKITFPIGDVVIQSYLGVNREALAIYFKNNNLEFQDIRKATYSTQAFLLEITLESMSMCCKQCTKGISKGYACLDCGYQCMECYGCKTSSIQLKEMRAPIALPNLFKKEYNWKEFKDKILKTTCPNTVNYPIPMNIAGSNFTVLLKHCSGCGKDNCWKCKVVLVVLTIIFDGTLLRIKQEDRNALIGSIRDATGFDLHMFSQK